MWLLTLGLAFGQSGPAPAGDTPVVPDAPEPAAEPEPEPEPEVPATLESLDAEMKALREELALLRAAREATEAQNTALVEEVAAQQRALEDLNGKVTKNRLKLLEVPDLSFDLEGHFRIRGYVFNHLWASQGTGDDYRDARYMAMQTRLQPVIKYRELATLNLEVRALDGVVFGDNQSLNSTALFAFNPSDTGIEGRQVPSVSFSRMWAEFSVPVGILRVGRQPSDWGLGLLANDGNGFDDTFGENHYQTTTDRILFATRPVTILQTILGSEGPEIPIIAAVAVDRVVEDPLIQYYGFRCDTGVPDTDDDYDPRCDRDGDGVTDIEHDFDEDRDEDRRGRDWWADQNDDVQQMTYVLAYRGEDVKVAGKSGDLTAGIYVVNRVQRETDSNAWIFDGHTKIDIGGLYVEAEGVFITGRTRALVLPDFSQDDPLQKTAGIGGYVARAGWKRPGYQAVFETGYASGDAAVNDASFTGRALAGDYNVGLLLYEEVLKEVTAAFWTDSARGLWSNGGVYNSRYIFPTAAVRPLDNWELSAGLLFAWPDKADGAIIKCRDTDNVDCALAASQQATTDLLGWEVDAAIKHRWHEHLLFSLEGGVAKATDRVSLAPAGLNPEGNFFTVQSRMAWEF
ncbi:MAG: hypothetical protein R3F61_30840 [Myxococcota bacterium]